MAENTSPILFFDDGEIRMYFSRAPAPVQSCCDRAVIEAGFATEPLRHCVTELLGLLTDRMSDGVKGFTHAEWIAVRNARELIDACDEEG